MSQIFAPPPVSLIPESAPFSAEQREWLNGFFAGWLGMTGDSAAGATVGTSAAAAIEEEAFPWHDPALALEQRLELARDKPLPRKLMAAMAQLDCGACGYLCQTYAEKIASGEETSFSLCSPGGKETSKALKKIAKEAASQTGATSNGAADNGSAVKDAAAAAGWTRQNPYTARVLRASNLNGVGSAKVTTHVEIDLGDGGLDYTVGDSLGVWPTNCNELVHDLLGQLHASGEEPVTVERVSVPLAQALRERCCLTEITEELLLALAETADGEEADSLRNLVDDDGLIHGCDVLDLLRLFPTANIRPAGLAAALSPLRPRLYSISSSLKAHPGQVHLTVGRVAWEHNGRTRKGVTSTLFADRLADAHPVRVFVQKSHGFTVPADPAAGMIMIGPGTGIAPFRAFMEERAATGATGPNWLFFGDQHAATDFLYREQLEGYVAANLLTRLETAFSRDGNDKVYVQHRMTQQAAELWRWLEAGAYLYVCGDAKRMAADVDAALHGVVQSQGGLSEQDAKAYVKALVAAGRYARDVY